MHFRGLDLNLLVALDALLSEQSVTRAAERLHVTQPAMSAALQKLRHHLGDPLLERAGRRLELTPRARELAEPVSKLLVRIRNVLDAQPVFDPKSSRRIFRLAMSDYCAEMLAAPIFRRVMETAPAVGCQFHEINSETLTKLHDGKYDFCITVTKRALLDISYDHELLSEMRLFSDQFVLVAAADNAAIGNSITYDEFCEQPYIEVRVAGDHIATVDYILRGQQRRPAPRAAVPNYLQAMTMVSCTNAVAAVPLWLFKMHGRRLRLKRIEPPFRIPELTENCVWHSRNDRDPGHQWFVGLLKDVVDDLFGERVEGGLQKWHSEEGALSEASARLPRAPRLARRRPLTRS